VYLQTNRLYLRNLRLEDIPAVHAYRNDPDCRKYQRWEDISLAAITEFVKKFAGSTFLSNQEEQHYAICLTGGQLVGELSYFYTEADRCVTLGITIAPEYQRRGFAREMLEAVVKAVQNRHSALDIVALIHPQNCASVALFESLGFYRECYARSVDSYVYVIDGIRMKNTGF